MVVSLPLNTKYANELAGNFRSVIYRTVDMGQLPKSCCIFLLEMCVKLTDVEACFSE